MTLKLTSHDILSICGQRIYQKNFLNWFCQYFLSFLNIFLNRFCPVEKAFLNWLCQYLSFLNIFFTWFCPMEKVFLNWLCPYLSFLNIFSTDFPRWRSFSQLIVSIFIFPQYFFNRICPVEKFSQLIVSIFIFSKCFFTIDFARWKSLGVTLHCLYRDSLTSAGKKPGKHFKIQKSLDFRKAG